MDIIKFLLPKTFCAEFQLKKKFVKQCAYMFLWGYVHMITIACRGQKRTADTLKLKVDVALSYLMWVLETEDRSSTRVAFPLNC